MAKKTKNILKGYYAHCSVLDSYIKRLQDAIKRSNIEDNTIFVFSSDHGDMINSHGQTKKQRIFEESVKLPFIIKYPALLGKEEKKSDFLLKTLDILPTMLGLFDNIVPAGLDGEDITDIILGNKKDEREAALISSIQSFGQWPRRIGGKKLRGLVTKKYTYAQDLSGEWLLFDNDTDPYQLNNMIGNPAFEAIAKSLDRLLANELSRLDDEFLPGSAYIEKWGFNRNGTLCVVIIM